MIVRRSDSRDHSKNAKRNPPPRPPRLSARRGANTTMPKRPATRSDVAPSERNDGMRLRPLVLAALAVLLSAHSPLRADVKPNPLVSDGMVLQQKQSVRVWGTADPGEKITVRFRDVTTTTQAD